MKTIKIIIGIISFLILIIFALLQINLYPVALTSKWIVADRQFNKVVNSSLFYYQKTFAVYTTSTPVIDIGVQKEIKRAALDKLIEDKIVNETLLKKLSSKELDKLVNDKLANLTVDNEKVANASQVLYNLSLKDFTALVLIPEARREILKERGIDLQELKKSYQPIILLPGFYWQNEVLIRTNG